LGVGLRSREESKQQDDDSGSHLRASLAQHRSLYDGRILTSSVAQRELPPVSDPCSWVSDQLPLSITHLFSHEV
jgi:hypothetical protein